MSIRNGIFAIVFLLSLACIFLFVEESGFGLLISLFSLTFGAYLLLVRKAEHIHWKPLILLVILSRLISFVNTPQLSDDYYRFFWDAKVVEKGMSPYAEKPAAISDELNDPQGSSAFEKMNSPEYYSVYTPFHQLLFYCAYKLSNGKLEMFPTNFRILLLFFDLMMLVGWYYLCRGGRQPKKKWLLLALHPLIIVEGLANLHAEIIVLAGMVLILLSIEKGRKWGLSGWWLAISTKLNPLIWIPAVVFPHLQNGNFRKAGMLIIVVLLAFLSLFPIWTSTSYIGHFFDSLSLYAQSFEFNASVYLILRELLEVYYGYNPIQTLGPALQILALLLILFISMGPLYKTKPDEHAIIKKMTIIGMVYFLLSTTIHPWYILPLLPLAIRSKLISPIVWSFAIMLSYANYSTVPFPEFFIWLEYIMVFPLFLYDLWGNKKGLQSKHD